MYEICYYLMRYYWWFPAFLILIQVTAYAYYWKMSGDIGWWQSFIVPLNYVKRCLDGGVPVVLGIIDFGLLVTFWVSAYAIFFLAWLVLSCIIDYYFARNILMDCDPLVYALCPYGKYVFLLRELNYANNGAG